MDLLTEIQNYIMKVESQKTKVFREIANKYRKEISAWNILKIYTLCEALLKNKNRGVTIVAYQIIFDNKNKYNEQTFDIFEKWLYLYIEDWWDCDDFMTHGFQYLLMKYPENLFRIRKWVTHNKFAVRRSAAVILIRPSQRGLLEEKTIFHICDLLIDDNHYLVQKGYGWLLKESSNYYYDAVIQYLEKNIVKMSRTAFKYALEKLPKDVKKRLMSL